MNKKRQEWPYTDKGKMNKGQHDWSIQKVGGTLCSYCRRVRMPNNEDAECDKRPETREVEKQEGDDKRAREALRQINDKDKQGEV